MKCRVVSILHLIAHRFLNYCTVLFAVLIYMGISLIAFCSNLEFVFFFQIIMMLRCPAILSYQNSQTSVLLLYLQVNTHKAIGFLLWQFIFLMSWTIFYFAVLDSLVEPLQKTINHKPKQDAVKQEVDRNDDMIRSALRAIASLNRLRFFSYLNCRF